MIRWEDLQEISASGNDIGSHTRTHKRLSDISGDFKVLKNEIIGSKDEIELQLGIECKYISWPYGRLTDKDKISIDMVQDAGYKACFGAYRGTIVPGETAVYSIPRHQVELHWPIAHIEYFARGNMEL